MKTANNKSRRGQILGIALLATLAFGMMGCNEGYVGPDGAPLLYYLPPANLLEIVENPDPDIRLIDVRPPLAYQGAHIPTAENYPSGAIAGIIDNDPNEMPLETCYIVMCETGPRAQAVIVNVLEPRGYRCFMNYGASIRWPYGFVSGPDPGTL